MRYEEIKEFALNFNTINPSKEEQNKLKDICDYLKFVYKDCGCTSLWHTLYEKLTHWLKVNKEICKYDMVNGKFLTAKDGKLVYKFNLTNKYAEELLQTEEGQQFITLKDEFKNQEEETVETQISDEEVKKLDDSVKAIKTRKSGKRTIKKTK